MGARTGLLPDILADCEERTLEVAQGFAGSGAARAWTAGGLCGVRTAVLM